MNKNNLIYVLLLAANVLFAMLNAHFVTNHSYSFISGIILAVIVITITYVLVRLLDESRYGNDRKSDRSTTSTR